jgi:hypothetical protein
MINEGFKTTASQEDVHALDNKAQALARQVTTGVDRIAHLLLAEQKRKIENLATRMKNLEDAFAISPHAQGRQMIAERF